MEERGGSDWLNHETARCLGQAVEAMTGQAPAVSRGIPPAAPPAQAAPGELCWLQPFDVRAEAAVWLSAPHALWYEIGRRALVAAGLDEPEEADIRSTFLEIVTQALSALAQALSTLLGRDIGLAPAAEAPPPAPIAQWSALTVQWEGTDLPPLLAGFTAGLVALAGGPPQRQSWHSPTSVPPASAPPPDKTVPADLLLDVELPVSVSFGRAQLLLKEVVKLTTGSIIELNRSVSEPVEVIVNNCVIARGEVVVVEGNYGVRIRQIISRQERLRTLD